jgi:hypothetical protein
MTNIDDHRPHAPIFRRPTAAEITAANCQQLAKLADRLVDSHCERYGLNPETLSPSPILALERARSERDCA